MQKENIKSIILLLSLSAFVFIGSNTLMPLWAHYTKNLGGDLHTAGNALALFFICFGVGSLCFSFCAVRLQRFNLCIFITSLIAAGLLYLLNFVNDVERLYLVEAAIGTVLGIQAPIVKAKLALAFPKSHSTLYWAFFATLKNLSIGLGCFIGAYLVHYYHYHEIFNYSALIVVASACCIFLLGITRKETIRSQAVALEDRMEGDTDGSYIFVLLFTISIFFTAMNFITPLWSNYVASIGGSVKSTGIAVGIFFWGYAGFTCLLGVIENYYQIHRWYIVSSYLLTTALYAGYFFIHSVELLYLLQLGLAFTSAIQSPAFDEHYTQQFKAQHQLLGQSLYKSCYCFAIAAGAWVGAHIGHYFGFAALFGSMVSFGFIGFLVAAVTFYLYERRIHLFAAN